ncbi:methyltransferase domain-containing protein [Actinomyces bowdenii]|uniref:class I SAM-dependent methyltransferase n=1 Tax=Actinomyces bowdenii TaxID=131109 RepID=UPI001ABC63B0|nr:class I SAM-dependent methyltransferase [Actinomyces bowdenii]MBO3724664.1 methyltransferase domain-containing protein [Actinomyces bowdenii]
MSMDFHAESSAGAYASRGADPGWVSAVAGIVDLRGLRVVDIGCGGGIYSTAMAQMGALVTGVDFSARMVSDARERARGLGAGEVRFVQGDAACTGLPDGSADAVLLRALIHHVRSIPAVLAEARRLLIPGGILLIQDRTMEDVLAPSSAEHFRGWFFEIFPHLIDVEAGRRPGIEEVDRHLREAGFGAISHHRLAELRRSYDDLASLRADLLSRTGRSILHELDDGQLALLVDGICARIARSAPTDQAIREVDYWTLWWARADHRVQDAVSAARRPG